MANNAAFTVGERGFFYSETVTEEPYSPKFIFVHLGGGNYALLPTEQVVAMYMSKLTATPEKGVEES